MFTTIIKETYDQQLSLLLTYKKDISFTEEIDKEKIIIGSSKISTEVEGQIQQVEDGTITDINTIIKLQYYRLNQLLNDQRLIIYDTPPDGDCLFYCIADQIEYNNFRRSEIIVSILKLRKN